MIKRSIKSVLIFCVLTVFLSTTIRAQEGTVIVNQDPQIDKLLALKKDLNKEEANYRIQIYSGSKAGAENARSNFYGSFSGWSADLVYETPNYKIWVGRFKTRLEADRALLRIRQKFGSAFRFKPKKD